MKNPPMATREDSLLLIIDIQDRLIPTIFKADGILLNIETLIKLAEIYQIPILVTEQKKLGTTTLKIKEILMDSNSYNPIGKLDFSCYRNEEFRRVLKETNVSNILVCGIETHICVSQTALDLMQNGYIVHIIRDATSSHKKEDYETAIERLRDSGAVITTTEALIYELSERAGTQKFKRILELVKNRRDRLDRLNQN